MLVRNCARAPVHLHTRAAAVIVGALKYAHSGYPLGEADPLPPDPLVLLRRTCLHPSAATPGGHLAHLAWGWVHVPDDGVVTTAPQLSRRCAGIDPPGSPARAHLRHAQRSRVRQRIVCCRAAGAPSGRGRSQRRARSDSPVLRRCLTCCGYMDTKIGAAATRYEDGALTGTRTGSCGLLACGPGAECGAGT